LRRSLVAAKLAAPVTRSGVAVVAGFADAALDQTVAAVFDDAAGAAAVAAEGVAVVTCRSW
jgi:hypothetical protein